MTYDESIEASQTLVEAVVANPQADVSEFYNPLSDYRNAGFGPHEVGEIIPGNTVEARNNYTAACNAFVNAAMGVAESYRQQSQRSR